MTASVAPHTDVFMLDLAITLALALALPTARWWAGVRLAEPLELRRRATLWTGAGMLAWLALTGALGLSGALDHWDGMPPRVMPLLAISTALVVGLACSRFGARLIEGLPVWLLVGYQAFRIPVEVMLHRAYEQGVIGVQMTWSGRNFDVVTGLLALGLGLWLWRRGEERPLPRGVIGAWNLLGLGLLINIVSVAILSMPTPMRMFDGPANTFVATFPYVWLPTVMVMAALFGHLLVARRLVRTQKLGAQR
ncbi:hypothetical protein ACNOYE_28890 [Nannocystaceae bacterium ST9]